MGMFGSKRQDEGVDILYLQDLHGQMLAIFDHINTLALEVEKTKQFARENNKLLRELVALGWKLNGREGISKAEGGAPRSPHGEDNQGEGEGAMRVPMVGGHGVEEVPGASRGAGH